MINQKMDLLLASYWGKADPKFQLPNDHHTVLGHSLDVAACAFSIVEENYVLKATLSKELNISLNKTAITLAALCALHDIGKLDTRFQCKAPKITGRLRPTTQKPFKGKYDHGVEGYRLYLDENRSKVQNILGENSLPLFSAVCGHHGSMPGLDDPNPSLVAVHPILRQEDVKVRDYFFDSVTCFFITEEAELPFNVESSASIMQRVGGLCAIADWVGSNTEYFKYQPGVVSFPFYWQKACNIAKEACRSAGLLRAKVDTSVSFETLFPGYSPRDVQLLTEAISTDEPSLVIVEAEMGKGKTEAAISLASKYLANNHSEGITTLLPTMATSNAMFGRIKEAADKIYKQKAPEFVLAHSRARKLKGFSEIINKSYDDEASVTCSRWFLSRKRVLLSQLGVGTIDQGLKAALCVKHQFVSMFGLSRNVVIIDEVHAYDCYMEALLDHLLSWLGKLNVPVILLSATLPSCRKAELVAAWQGQTRDISYENYEAAKNQPYPLVTVASKAIITTKSGVSNTLKTVYIELSEKFNDNESYNSFIINQLISAAEKGARVVWIRNTVTEAQEAYEKLKSLSTKVESILFHARFRGLERSEIESKVLDRFGKKAPEGGRILIATQVVEQSLDLDFDLMHTDLCPIDLLLQRLGRLHRHDRARLSGFEKPKLVFHVPSKTKVNDLKFGSTGKVYNDTVNLWLTYEVVEKLKTITLPNDLRSLVEQVYHPEIRQLQVSAASRQIQEKNNTVFQEFEGMKVRAKNCCIPPSDSEYEGFSTMSDSDYDIRKLTREGDSYTYLLVAWDGKDITSLYGSKLDWDFSTTKNYTIINEMTDHTLTYFLGFKPTTSIETEKWDEWVASYYSFTENSKSQRMIPVPFTKNGDSYVGECLMFDKPKKLEYSLDLGLRIRKV